MLEPIAELFKRPYDPGEEMPWWKDNAGHLISGVAIGGIAHGIAGGIVIPSLIFIALAVVWELFEWRYNIRPWDPRDDWTFDRAIEDTLLDTFIGLTGAIAAAYLLISF